MCHIFATQEPGSYEPITKALRINGHTTSIRLEAEFWTILDEIARRESLSTPRFLGKLYDEVIEYRGSIDNFSSLLRVTCLLYLRRRGVPAAAPARPAKESIAVVS